MNVPKVLCPFLVGLLAFVFATAGAQVSEYEEDSAGPASERTIVYDYSSDAFVRVRRTPASPYQIGTLRMNVGYEERLSHAKETWPYNVNRFLFRRPLDQ